MEEVVKGDIVNGRLQQEYLLAVIVQNEMSRRESMRDTV